MKIIHLSSSCRSEEAAIIYDEWQLPAVTEHSLPVRQMAIVLFHSVEHSGNSLKVTTALASCLLVNSTMAIVYTHTHTHTTSVALRNRGLFLVHVTNPQTGSLSSESLPHIDSGTYCSPVWLSSPLGPWGFLRSAPKSRKTHRKDKHASTFHNRKWYSAPCPLHWQTLNEPPLG